MVSRTERADPHSAFRQQVRDQAIEYAHQRLITDGWDKITVGDVATAIGVSRPTIYAEFGNKEGLAEAILFRAVDIFIAGITDALNQHRNDPEAACAAAMKFTQEESERSPLVKAVLTQTGEGNETLLRLLTTGSMPVYKRANVALVAWFEDLRLDLSRQELIDAIDTIVRVGISHVLQPDDKPKRTPEKIGRLAKALLQPR